MTMTSVKQLDASSPLHASPDFGQWPPMPALPFIASSEIRRSLHFVATGIPHEAEGSNMRRAKQAFRKEVAPPTPDDGLVGRRVFMDAIPAPSTYARPPLAPSRLGKRVRVPPSTQVPRFQYAPFRTLDVDRILAQSSTAQVQVRVPAAHLTSKNEGVRRRLLWGSDEYTDDSDVVAMLVHSGRIVLHAKGTAPFDALLVNVALERHSRESSPFRARDGYGLRSRAWNAPYDGARVSVKHVTAVRDGLEQDLPRPVLALVHTAIPRLRPWHLLAADGARGSGDAAFPPETACFDLSNRPCLTFALAIVADKGYDKSLWPSRRLWREVLYVETDNTRYEIAKVEAPEREPAKDKDGKEKDGGKDKEGGKEREGGKEKRKGLFVRFAQVSAKAVRRDIFAVDASAVAGPMDVADLEAGFGVHKWSSIRWDPMGLTLGGVHYDLKRVSFRPIARKRDVEKTDAK